MTFSRVLLLGLLFLTVSCKDSQSTPQEPSQQPQAVESKPEKAVEAKPVGHTSSANTSLLKDYEKFLVEYLAAVKKAKTGDMSAVSEMQKLMEKAQDWTAKYQAQAPTMSEAEQKEYQRLSEKFAKDVHE